MTRTPHWRCDGCAHLNTQPWRCQRQTTLPDLTRDQVLGRAPAWCPADGKPFGATAAVATASPLDGAVLAAQLLRLGNELASASPITQHAVAEAAERIAADARTKPADKQCWTMLVTRLRGASLERTA